MDHKTNTLRESIGKRTYFKKEMREEKKNTRVFIWAQTERAIQHLHDEFQIGNINKNYGHANAQASDKFVMRMRKWLTKRKMFRIIFKQLMQPSPAAKGRTSILLVKCSVAAPQTFTHSFTVLLPVSELEESFSLLPPSPPHDAPLL